MTTTKTGNPILSPAADPVPGHLGHFDHHMWLKESVQYLNTQLNSEVARLDASIKVLTTRTDKQGKDLGDWANELNALSDTAPAKDIVAALKRLAVLLSRPA